RQLLAGLDDRPERAGRIVVDPEFLGAGDRKRAAVIRADRCHGDCRVGRSGPAWRDSETARSHEDAECEPQDATTGRYRHHVRVPPFSSSYDGPRIRIKLY